MTGARTIAALFIGLSALVVLGATMASCLSRDLPPPLPREPNVQPEPLRLADTKVVRAEILSDDAAYRLEQQCLGEHGTPRALATFVHCERGGPSRAGWMVSIHDVPDWRRGVK